MKLNFKNAKLLSKFIIWLDRGLNFITSGSFKERLSTCFYVQALLDIFKKGYTFACKKVCLLKVWLKKKFTSMFKEVV